MRMHFRPFGAVLSLLTAALLVALPVSQVAAQTAAAPAIPSPAMQGHPPLEGNPAMQGHPPMPGHPPMQGHPPMAGHPPMQGQSPAPQGAPGAVQPYRLPAELFATPRFGRPGAPAAAAAPPKNEGTVMQSQTAGGYTYIEVTGPNGNQWLAAPAMLIENGTRIRYEGGAVMSNFTSKAVNRTFESIIFVGGVEPIVPNEGIVTQSQTAGGYTYVEINRGAKGMEWLAAPAMSVKVGDKVRYEGGSVMKNFSSKAVNKTFDSIVFVGGLDVVAGETSTNPVAEKTAEKPANKKPAAKKPAAKKKDAS